MARNKSPDPIARTEQADPGAVSKAASAQDAQRQRSTEIAALFGDGQPYERERVIGMARTYMAASAEAMLEAGKCLVQLKENEAHGEFLQIVERRLGLPARTAQRMMSASVKFLSPALAAKAPTLALLGKSKLFELMAEDDSNLSQLSEGGTLAGATLDEIDAMSARELRAALVEERKRTAAKDRLIAKKDTKLNEAIEREEMRRAGKPDEREQLQMSELRDAGLRAEQSLQALVASVDEVMREPATEAAELAARQTIDYLVQRLADALLHRGITVDLMGERIDPQWAKQIADTAAKGSKRRG